MKESLELLQHIQKIEIETRELEDVLGQAPRRLEHLDARLAEEQRLRDEETRHVDELQKQYRSLEGDAQQAVSTADKSKEKLRHVKTNKEYQATLKEIEDLESTHSQIEDQMIECLERLDTLESRIDMKKAAFESFASKMAVEKEAVRQEVSRARNHLATLSQTHREIAGRIDSALLQQFERVKKLHANKIAIVPVVNAVCQGCNLNIPPQMYNELHGGNEVMYCPNCQRMIYLKKAEQQA